MTERTLAGSSESLLLRLVRTPSAWFVLDEVVWLVALLSGTTLRWLYVTQPIDWSALGLATIVTLAAHAVVAGLARLYTPGAVRGSFDELLRLGITVAVAGVALLLIDLAAGRFVPGTVPVIATVLAGGGMLAARLAFRALQGRHADVFASPTPVVLVGGRQAAQAVAQNRSGAGSGRFRVVALVDARGDADTRAIDGIPVSADTEGVSDLAGRLGVRTVVLALDDVDTDAVRRLVDEFHGTETTVLALESSVDLGDGPPRHGAVRPLGPDDLLGRRSAVVDDEAISDQVRGRTVLVTGAGGGMGAALCQELARAGATSIVLMDRDESAMNAVLLELRGRGLGEAAVTVLADVRDAEAVREAFLRHRPHVVVHAAGLQNVAMLERQPGEAWKSNVMGTLHVLEAACAANVLATVNLSGDDADRPTTVRGFTHAIAERLVASYDDRCAGRFLSVRLGTLVGAPGGVTRVFEMQIRHGGPVTVAGLQASERFMRVREAAQLVLQCAVLSDGGDVMLLDSGDPVPLAEVARAMTFLAGRPDIRVVAAGEGTPVDAESQGAFQSRLSSGSATWHPSIRSIRPGVLDDVVVQDADDRGEISPAMLRFLALGSPCDLVESAAASTPEALDWRTIEREWAQDEIERAPDDAFAEALLLLQSQAVDRQAEDVDRIVRAAGGPSGVHEGTSGDASPAPEPIYLSKADVGPLEEKWVLKAMRSGYVAPLGPMVDEFERRVAERTGVKHALALSSGTAALHLLLMHVGAGPGTFVVLPTMTFAATANAVMYTGATPFFVDVHASDANIDVDLMLEAVDRLQGEGREVSAVVTVDLYGRCCDYTRIEPELAKRGVPLVEDAAEALGASHAGRAAGSFGVGAALSFNGNKIMTTSGGGMLLSDDGDLIERARYLSTQARRPVPWYEHVDVGYNYRMSNVLAGLGIAQLSRLDGFVERRRQIRGMYADLAAGLRGGRLLGVGDGLSDAEDNCWLTSLVWDVEPDALDGMIADLGRDGIEARHLWKPLHASPVFSTCPRHLSGTAMDLFSSGMNLPSGAGLRDDEVLRVRDTVARMASGVREHTVVNGAH